MLIIVLRLGLVDLFVAKVDLATWLLDTEQVTFGGDVEISPETRFFLFHAHGK